MIGVREYGSDGPLAVLVHGGPGAPGSLASLARALAPECRVLEALQRSSGDAPLTVAGHVADLEGVVGSCPAPPVVVGHSWGAMLALAHAAEHPSSIAGIALIGCGTFDEAARRELEETRAARLSAADRRRLDELCAIPDATRRLTALGGFYREIDSVDLVPEDRSGELPCDPAAFDETWTDMMRLQAEAVFPGAFGTISAPAAMFHGRDDPHPADSVYASLIPRIPHLELHTWPDCGHHPWLERHARTSFVTRLVRWVRSASSGFDGKDREDAPRGG